jgi:2,4-dienoyl-CoA reductase (NADPH2)
VFSAREWLSQRPVVDGPVAVLDPIGGPIGVSVAETLAGNGHQVHLVTQDHIAGNELARTGDLAPANARLQQAGVIIERRSIPRVVSPGQLELEDRFTGQRRTLAAAAVVDAGFRVPDLVLWEATGCVRAGDAVAPRTVYEAVLEARRAILALEAVSHPAGKAVLA